MLITANGTGAPSRIQIKRRRRYIIYPSFRVFRSSNPFKTNTAVRSGSSNMPLARKILTIAVNIPVLLLLLLFVELGLRVLHLGYSNCPVDADHVLNWRHPFNYRYKMFTPSGEFGGFPVYFDSLGRRAQVPELAPEHSLSDSSIVFLGDSFVEGIQVPYDSTFIGLLAARFPHVSFLNYGVTGYGAVLYYLQCRTMLEQHRVQPSAVIMMLYSNDVRDDSAFLDRAISGTNNEITAIDGGDANGLLQWLRNSYLARTANKIYLQQKYSYALSHHKSSPLAVVNGYAEEAPGLDRAITSMYIRKTDSLLRQRNIALYVTAVPSRYSNFTGSAPDSLFAARAMRWCQANSLRFIDLQHGFAVENAARHEHLFFEKDVHFNAAGHRLAASILEETIAKITRN